ncbi:MAG: flagellar biosynthesis protein FlhA [Deltaproteobacteria bacterium]|nr:flagellar biosynthesis protein FlhA [Deltaproteobacteria bacterium]MBW1928491.1 flagellar biosynthesis protein FlhA [Deltaproteobacteria bacterium]MBW2024175.1 flagellar biosynthesis protein FlhA [Deltaproteobacteria bacterium]MBW2125800.1 flagellar biosynthesis protein FlhA [Deltaproteobacteria bacterium]RLB13316.1 MAG: flagellar biosynthesis protein FlhA [Deltaproteobacteria bacterium]
MPLDSVRLSAGRFSLSANSDVTIAIGIVGILLVMIIPLPTPMLDMLLALNITLSVLILLLTIYTLRPLDFSVFPSLLLITTLFRLSLNIASTRLILLNGDKGSLAAGKIIKSFGAFVVGGNTTVGLVVFMILVVINFVVITKGAGRIAEVAARFTLDAMPGKQMSIDADLNAGLIDEAEARARRAEISKEAEFYGAMDGASKFVRGDAIAGIIITMINIIGGLVIGVIQKHLDLSTAVQNYTLLTIGDGLVSQIPALIISTAAGILVSRAASEANMGLEVARQFSLQPRALRVASGIIFLFALAPGMPAVPFMLLAGTVYFLSRTVASAQETAVEEAAEEREKAAAQMGPEQVEGLLPLDLLELEIGYGLIPLVDSKAQGNLLERIRALRKQYALEMGLIIPSLHIRDNLELKPNEYAICIKGNEVARAELMMDHYLAIDPGDVKAKVEGIETREPAFGLPALWIAPEKKGDAQLAGYTVVDLPSVVITHLSEVVKQYGYEFLGRQEVQRLLDNLATTHPKAVEELTPSQLTLGAVQKILQNLVREQVSIRDLLTIVETLADYAPITKDTDLLTEYVRQRLARTLVKPYLDKRHVLKVLTVAPDIEDRISRGINQTEYGAYLALDPGEAEAVINAIKRAVDKAAAKIDDPVLLCSATIRRHLRKLCERFQLQVAVISHNEIPSGVQVESVGEVGI